MNCSVISNIQKMKTFNFKSRNFGSEFKQKKQNNSTKLIDNMMINSRRNISRLNFNKTKIYNKLCICKNIDTGGHKNSISFCGKNKSPEKVESSKIKGKSPKNSFKFYYSMRNAIL